MSEQPDQKIEFKGPNGWPRKNEEFRLYREKDGGYMLLDAELPPPPYPQNYEGLTNVRKGPEPSLCSGSCSPQYIYENRLKRVQWNELPLNWQAAFSQWLNDPDYPFKPENIRGFWRVRNFNPSKKEEEF